MTTNGSFEAYSPPGNKTYYTMTCDTPSKHKKYIERDFVSFRANLSHYSPTTSECKIYFVKVDLHSSSKNLKSSILNTFCPFI